MQDINSVGRLFIDRRIKPHNNHHSHHQQLLKCPRCESSNTKFCYYNNYNLSQPRHFCKNCRRYWTKGGVLRNVPVGGGCRKSKPKSKPKPKPKPDSPSSETSNTNHHHSPFQIGDDNNINVGGNNLFSGELINLMNNNNNNNSGATSFSELMENQSGGAGGGIIGEWSGGNSTVRIEDLLENDGEWENPTVDNGLFDFTSAVDHHQAYWSQTSSTLSWTPHTNNNNTNNSSTNDLPLFLP